MNNASKSKKLGLTANWENVPQLENSELLLLLCAYGPYVRRSQVIEICKIADSTLDALKNEKDASFDPSFPIGHQITPRTVVYSTVELYSWITKNKGGQQ